MSVLIAGSALLALTLSLDAFAAAFAYGCKQIKIPLRSGGIIAVVCTATTGLSFLVGSALVPHMPNRMAAGISFAILFLVGMAKLLDSLTKALIRKHTDINKEIALSLFNFKFILRVYADPESADVDISKHISPREAAVLALSLSLDGFAVGLGAALLGLQAGWVLTFSLLANALALLLGSALGNKAAQNLRFNISWLAGVLLIVLAFSQWL
ncbi:MAG: sporulation membrane protein YtaF [Defluviitaleaceae bacterium]|nr:sporulation membrane protein YtaF [Defluviitaleaceae bacterium]MCL2203785.1 sporulation membrane protein YtaF [Defluviitaleaceae bacterium]MCL2239254.1 sporulation membrane protein YtaF [Defluviitaleaceae bacterium]